MKVSQAVEVLRTIQSEHGDIEIRLLKHDDEGLVNGEEPANQIVVRSSDEAGEAPCVLILDVYDADMLYEGG